MYTQIDINLETYGVQQFYPLCIYVSGTFKHTCFHFFFFVQICSMENSVEAQTHLVKGDIHCHGQS